MTEAVVRYGKDTWAGSGAPGVNHNDANLMKLNSGSAYGFLHAKSPVPLGLTVPSATLTVYVAKTSDWTGSKTISLKRLAERVPFGTLTWNNKPGVTGAAKTVTVSGAVDGQALVFDVASHVQTVANGDPHYGWRLETNSGTAHRIYGYESDYPPILTVEYAISPSQPVDLSPAGGAVSLQFPVFQFDAVDLSNPQDMTDLQIQIGASSTRNADGSLTTPEFDTGWVASTVPEWTSAGSAWVGISAAATRYWVARYRDGSVVGDWSEPVSFTRTAKGTVTITNPAVSPNNFVAEATPPLTHTFSGTQAAWRKFVALTSDPTEIVADSGKTAGTALSWTPPAKKLQDDGAYTLYVRVWDSVSRVRTPGDPIYAEASRAFTFQQDATVTAPTMVSALQQGVTPLVDVTFTRATMPDSWTILRDGKVIDAGVDPVDTLTAGTTHVYTDSGASPQVAHTYEVRAVVNGKASPKSAAGTVTTYPEDVWLLDGGRGLYVRIKGAAVDNWRRTDHVAVYPLVGGGAIQVFMGSNGIAGDFSGTLRSIDGRTTAQWRADFDAIADKLGRTYQLVAANLSIPVKVRNASATPHPDTQRTNPMDRVYFEFFEVD